MARNVPGVTGEGNRWFASAYDPAAGKKVRVKNASTGTTVFPSQESAAVAKEEFERTKKQPRTRAYTADQWVKEWTTNAGYNRRARSTNEHNAERVSKFAEDFKGVLLTAIDRPMARKWALENRTRSMAVRAMLNDAVSDEIIARNPFARLRLEQSRGRKDIAPLTPDEVDRLVEVADDLFPGWPVMGAVITTAAYGGLRLGEISALQWEDIGWEAGTIRVKRQYRQKQREETMPKSGLARTIALTEPVAHALRDLPHMSNEDLVFYTPSRYRRYSSSNHSHYWTVVRAAFWSTLPESRQALIKPDFDFHELRHFCGSWLADQGASAQDIAFQLGHQDGGKLAQELYIHVYEENALKRLRSTGRRRSGGTGSQEGPLRGTGS